MQEVQTVIDQTECIASLAGLDGIKQALVPLGSGKAFNEFDAKVEL